MRIGLYGGTFDPVHNSHIALARSAMAYAIDHLVITPCRNSPHKTGTGDAPLEPDEHRWNMLKLAFPGHPNISLSRFELNGPPISYTCHTIRYLQHIYTGARLVLIIGMDQTPLLHTWARYKEWAPTVDLLIFPRPGEPLTTHHLKHPARVTIAKETVGDTSSTQIRTLIKNGQSITHLVPTPVQAYILKNKLYTTLNS